MYITDNGGEAHITIATEKYSTNLKSQAETLQKEEVGIRDILPRTKPNVVIFTDGLSVLSKLQNPRQKSTNDVELPWSTSQPRQTWSCSGFHHTAGSKEMNTTGRLNRDESQQDEEDRHTFYADEKTNIKTLTKKKVEAHALTSQSASKWTEQSKPFCSGR